MRRGDCPENSLTLTLSQWEREKRSEGEGQSNSPLSTLWGERVRVRGAISPTCLAPAAAGAGRSKLYILPRGEG
jgi:hypothetical protein